MTALPAYASESALVARWLDGLPGPLQLQDGRPLKVIFPGIPGAGSGPDVRDALLDVGGDYLKGHVEMHLLASGWTAHGHRTDPAYRDVVLHVVGHDDLGAPISLHGAARTIPILVLPAALSTHFPGPAFTPPCALEAARGLDMALALRALSFRRLRMKAARFHPEVDTFGPAHALYAALMGTLGGPPNAAAFASLAQRQPLPALLEFAGTRPSGVSRPLALTAALKGAALDIPFRYAGIRPAASPAHRLDTAGQLVNALWPGDEPGWPVALAPGSKLLSIFEAGGIARGLAVELAVNAVLPVALAGAMWPESAVSEAWFNLPSPGTYGHLKPLESWLTGASARPFGSAAALQAGLLLHADYCSRGRCGRCPLTDRMGAPGG